MTRTPSSSHVIIIVHIFVVCRFSGSHLCQLLAHVCTFQYKAAMNNGQTFMTERVCILLPIVYLKRGSSNRLRAVVLFSSDHTRKVTVQLCKFKSERGGIGERFLPLRARVSRGLSARYINRARSTELRRTKRLPAVYSGKQAWLLASNRCKRGEINMLTYSNKNVRVFPNRPLFYCNENKLSIIM